MAKTATWAGLQSTYTADMVWLTSPDKSFGIRSGPMSTGSESQGPLDVMAHHVHVYAVELLHMASFGESHIDFGFPGADSHLWIRSFSESYTSDSIWTPLADVSCETGEWRYRQAKGSVRATLTPDNYQHDSVLALGVDNQTRGNVTLHAEHGSVAIEGSLSRPGVLALEAPDGVRVYLWARSEGGKIELRAGNADPQADLAPPNSVVLASW